MALLPSLDWCHWGGVWARVRVGGGGSLPERNEGKEEGGEGGGLGVGCGQAKNPARKHRDETWKPEKGSFS